MTSPRYLIVNADDFGRSAGINRGVARGFEQGIVTSASLMTRWPAAGSAADYAREHPGLSVGLHVDLAEWRFEQGEWRVVYDRTGSGAEAVEQEVAAQLEQFRALVGRDPTHLDSHQHVHRSEPARSLLLALARELDIPLREVTDGVAYSGGFYGQSSRGEPAPEAITTEALVGILESIPPGVTELACHPGEADEELDSVYRAERAVELAALCAPETRSAIVAQGIVLCSFADRPHRLR